MARSEQRHRWRRYGYQIWSAQDRPDNSPTGPAHAVYFGTYEVVKEFAGGNAEDGKHHPMAAGMLEVSYERTKSDTAQLHPARLQPLLAML
jgi:hypothetical protein